MKSLRRRKNKSAACYFYKKKLPWNRGQDSISEFFPEFSDFSKSSAFTDKAVKSYDTFCDRYLWHQVTDIWSCVAKDNLNWRMWLNLSQVCMFTSNVTSYCNDRYDRKCHVLKRTIGIMTNVTESVIDDKFNICHFSCTMSYVTKLQMQKCDTCDTLICHMCHTICHICYICDRMSPFSLELAIHYWKLRETTRILWEHNSLENWANRSCTSPSKIVNNQLIMM